MITTINEFKKTIIKNIENNIFKGNLFFNKYNKIEVNVHFFNSLEIIFENSKNINIYYKYNTHKGSFVLSNSDFIFNLNYHDVIEIIKELKNNLENNSSEIEITKIENDIIINLCNEILNTKLI